MSKLFWATTTLAALAVVVVVATLTHYQSLDPCDWLVRDVARTEGLTPAMATAKIRATFLLDGIVEPGAEDCLFEWWSFRGNSVTGAN